MTYYTVTITNNETKQKQTHYCNGIVGSLLNANETGATNIIKFNCNIRSALCTEVNLFCMLRKDITRIFDRIASGEFDIDDETLKQTIISLKISLKMLTEIVDEYEASDVTFDRVKLAKGGD